MDSTAYPHILERIVQQCCSVATLLALRATSRMCQAVADDILFSHVVLHVQCYRLAPTGPVRKVLKRLRKPRFRFEPRLILGLPASSSLDLDVQQLPFVPRKVHTLDVGVLGELGLDLFYDSFPWDEVHAPPVLRRYGRTTSYLWAGVRDTIVDFVVAKPPCYAGSCTSGQEVCVPSSTPKYVLHLCWPAGWDPVTVDPDSELEQRFHVHGIHISRGGLLRKVRDATLVFSPHMPSRSTIGRVITMFAEVFLHSLVFDASPSLTVVGLEVCPDLDVDEFKQSLRGPAIASSVRWWEAWEEAEPEGWPPPDRDAMARAYDGIQFRALEEWLESLGSMRDVVGVWPAPRDGTRPILPPSRP